MRAFATPVEQTDARAPVLATLLGPSSLRVHSVTAEGSGLTIPSAIPRARECLWNLHNRIAGRTRPNAVATERGDDSVLPAAAYMAADDEVISLHEMNVGDAIASLSYDSHINIVQSTPRKIPASVPNTTRQDHA